MRYYILLALIPLGAYAAASVTAAVSISLAWPALHRRMAARSAGDRARLLALVRLLPMLTGAFTAVIFATAFARYEPRTTTEAPGLLLALSALLTLLLCGAALPRLVRSWRAAAACAGLLRECGRRWHRADGLPVWVVETVYPVAAVTGFYRTRLLLSVRILRECTPREVEAVIRHETAHVRRRDNMVRAAMWCLPDPLGRLPAGVAMTRAWAAAVEEAADDEAAGSQIEARTELAAALVRVAGMAEGPPPAWMPALAFYQGSHLEHRVRRLLVAESTAPAAARSSMPFMLAVPAAALFLLDGVSRQLHALMELAVRYLP